MHFQKGMMLVFILWVFFLLSLFGLYLARGTRQRAIFIKRIGERSSLHFIGQASISYAIMAVLKDDSEGFDSFSDTWASDEEEFKNIKVNLGEFNVFYNYYEDGKIERKYGVVDEARKININKANTKTIERLFEAVFDMSKTEAKELSAAVIDFRDKDSYLLIPQGSAEDSYYRNLPEPYDCKDADYETVYELLLVKGIEKEMFLRLKDFVTIYGDKSVNINTAPREVLFAIGIERAIIDKIISYRKGEDGEIGTEDDRVFTSVQSVLPVLSQNFPLSPSEVENLSNIIAAGLIRVSSDYFRINSEARLSYSKAVGYIECVINREGKILFWRER